MVYWQDLFLKNQQIGDEANLATKDVEKDLSAVILAKMKDIQAKYVWAI